MAMEVSLQKCCIELIGPFSLSDPSSDEAAQTGSERENRKAALNDHHHLP